jgi:TM2 domain-containing membrane protein YozV
VEELASGKLLGPFLRRRRVNYYLAINGQQRGPFPRERLSQEGMTPDSLVWTEGMAQWQPAASVAELVELFTGQQTGYTNLQAGWAGPTTPGMMMVSYVDPHGANGTKIAAGLLGILFGAVGVHKFVIGATGAGIIMLLVSVLSCGLLSPIMHVIGVIEGIIYLTRSDQDFYQTYMVQKKAWF